jgi:N-acetylglutamate synthase-like GNAT family acetyltransferase
MVLKSVEFDISGSGYVIRPASPDDAKALRMLLPDMRDTAVQFVAIDGRHQLVIGAAMATRAFRRQPRIGPGVAVHVIKPCRQHGIGKNLIGTLSAFAKRAGANAMYAAKRVGLDGSEMKGWTSLGFEACETVEQHLLPLTQFEPQLAPLVERMRERGHIPANAQIIPLYQANLPAVLRLHLDNMGGDRGQLYRKLRGEGGGAFHPRYSRVLLVDGKIKGCILAHRRDKDTAVVDADIVEPSVRGGWANVLLKLEATRRAVCLGIKNFEFTSFDHYADTRSFTKKLGGATTRVSVLMYRPVDGNVER